MPQLSSSPPRLPPFAKPGMHIDVTVSSVGDAKSSARRPSAALLAQRPRWPPLRSGAGPAHRRRLCRRRAQQFQAGEYPDSWNHLRRRHRRARHLGQSRRSQNGQSPPARSGLSDGAGRGSAINQSLGKNLAHAIDSRRIEISGIDPAPLSAVQLLAKIEDLTVHVQPAAKVVISERTGTIVMGGDVTLSACSILHGNLTINVVTVMEVSQPYPKLPKEPPKLFPKRRSPPANRPSSRLSSRRVRPSRTSSKVCNRSAQLRATLSRSFRRSRPMALSTANWR